MAFQPPGPDDPFPHVATVIDANFPETYHVPKAYGTEGVILESSGILTCAGVNFSDAGCVDGEPCYVHEKSTPGTYVDEIDDADQTDLLLKNSMAAAFTAAVFKAGLGDPCTIDGIANLIAWRNLYAYTIKDGRIWTDVPEADFALDELGDIYCIGALS